MSNLQDFTSFFYSSINEDMTSAAFGPNSEIYTNLAQTNTDAYAPGDMRTPKSLGGKRKMQRRNKVENFLATGVTKIKRKK